MSIIDALSTNITTFLSHIPSNHERYAELVVKGHLCFISSQYLTNPNSNFEYALKPVCDFLSSHSDAVSSSLELAALFGLSHLQFPLKSDGFQKYLSQTWINSFKQQLLELFPEESNCNLNNSKSLFLEFSNLLSTSNDATKSIIDYYHTLVSECIGALVAVVSGEAISMDYIRSVKRRLKGLETSVVRLDNSHEEITNLLKRLEILVKDDVDDGDNSESVTESSNGSIITASTSESSSEEVEEDLMIVESEEEEEEKQEEEHSSLVSSSLDSELSSLADLDNLTENPIYKDDFSSESDC
ncbi:hypothetical protein RCL1_008624 [Eukaryota sp. TZLM3-RCL]